MVNKEASTIQVVDGKSIEELALDAESAIRDGYQSGDNLSIDSGVSGGIEILDAGHSWVYDVRNYQRSKVNNNMLRTQLQKTDVDVSSDHFGKRVFTTENLWAKGLSPKKGDIKCFLHKESPDRAKWDDMGYAVCPAGSLASPSNAVSHARRTHKAEWAAVAEDKERARNDLRDQLDRANLAALLRAQELAAPPPVVAPEPVTESVQENETHIGAPESFSASSGTCFKCDWTSEAPKAASRSNAYYKHRHIHE